MMIPFKKLWVIRKILWYSKGLDSTYLQITNQKLFDEF